MNRVGLRNDIHTHRKASPEGVTEEPRTDDTDLSRLGTKAVLNQQGKTS